MSCDSLIFLSFRILLLNFIIRAIKVEVNFQWNFLKTKGMFCYQSLEFSFDSRKNFVFSKGRE